MTFDPYHNRIPHGLLTDDEKAAMEATGGPWECLDALGRHRCFSDRPDGWFNDGIYRAVRKPLPVPQEGDVWVAPHGYSTHLHGQDSRDMIRKGYRLFREVKA
jgi:hypothetical protein